MDISSIPTFRPRPNRDHDDTALAGQSRRGRPQSGSGNSRCPHFAGFLAIVLAGDSSLGLHPFITNTFPTFEDIILGGGSFDVRKVKSRSFPNGLATDILKGRDFVVVKHPRAADMSDDWRYDIHCFADIATELQILRHATLKKHENIIDLLSVMYHDTGSEETLNLPRIVPALVLEYAEYGSLKAFQQAGHAASMSDRLKIAMDAAKGLKALHDVGIIHGDMKPSNLLVCKHPTREFIVKLSDFGFSISVQDGQFIGHSQMFCPPESYEGHLDRTQLPQVDIYSFGLTLLTIVEGGACFYDNIPAEGREENVREMKVSNIMCTLMPIRALSYFENSGLPVIILCKIFHCCLKADPKKRLRDMNRLIVLLELVEKVIAPVASTGWFDTASAEVMAQISVLSESSPSFSDKNLPSSPVGTVEQQKFQMFQSVLGALSQFTGWGITELPSSSSSGLYDIVIQLADLLLQLDHHVEVTRDYILGEVYHHELKDKVMTYANDVFGKAREDEIGGTVQVSLGGIFAYIVDLIGLLPEPSDFETSQTGSASPSGSQQMNEIDNSQNLRLCRHLDFIPDLEESYGIFQKMLPLVQHNAVQSLEMIFREYSDPEIRAAAAYSLAIAYVNGGEHMPSLKESGKTSFQVGRDYLYQAASLGQEKARTVFIELFGNHILPKELPPHDLWVDWLTTSAKAESPLALRLLRNASPESWGVVRDELRRKRLAEFAIDLSVWHPPDTASATQETSGQLLLWAIVHDHHETAERCIRAQPDLLHFRSGRFGETPLGIACRLARTAIVKILVEMGADVISSDGASVTPLHWISAFEGQDCHEIAALLVKKGSVVDAKGPPFKVNEYGMRIVPDPDSIHWTPLHLAVATKNLSAVDSLLNFGADPIFHDSVTSGKSTIVSPLELACSLCYSPVVSRLLQDPAAQAALTSLRPLIQGKPVMIRPLFSCLSGLTRWTRMKKLGPHYASEIYETLRVCVEHGAPTDAVLEIDNDFKMAAIFAVAYHQCPSEVMQAGLLCGFGAQIDDGNTAGKGDNALYMAINHRDHDMVQALLDAGARTDLLESGATMLERAAKESDDPFFVAAILDAGQGISIDPPPGSTSRIAAFETAVYSGNLKVAQFLFDRGADRDRLRDSSQQTTLGSMIHANTRSAVKRVKFLLSLPDRENGEDGFVVLQKPEMTTTALHASLKLSQEANTAPADITEVMVAQLLEKYDQPRHINSTMGPDGMTPLIMAIRLGHYRVARRLLDKGADPSAACVHRFTALDYVERRYLGPETVQAVCDAKHTTTEEFQRTLAIVNGNTIELVSLLASYSAWGQIGKFPTWYHGEDGLEAPETVLQRI